MTTKEDTIKMLKGMISDELKPINEFISGVKERQAKKAKEKPEEKPEVDDNDIDSLMD